MKPVSIIIDDMNMKKLKLMSKKLDRSVSWIVRQALKKYFPRYKKP
jgi:predicted transcriptional regulator